MFVLVRPGPTHSQDVRLDSGLVWKGFSTLVQFSGTFSRVLSNGEVVGVDGLAWRSQQEGCGPWVVLVVQLALYGGVGEEEEEELWKCIIFG